MMDAMDYWRVAAVQFNWAEAIELSERERLVNHMSPCQENKHILWKEYIGHLLSASALKTTKILQCISEMGTYR